MQEVFHLTDGVLIEMKDARSKRRVGFAFSQDIEHMLR